KPLQEMMLDAPGEGATTHYPRIDRQRVAVRTAAQHCDLPEAPVGIFIGSDSHERTRIVQERMPVRLAETSPVKVELIGLVNQFQSARIRWDAAGGNRNDS